MMRRRPGQPTVAFVEHKLNLETGGGSNLTLHQMACTLSEAGYRVYVITLAPGMNHTPRDLPYTVVEHKLSDTYLPIPKQLALVPLLFKWQRDVDLFQIESPSLMSSAGLYRLLGGRVPVVARLHTYTWFCSDVSRMDDECFRSCSLMDRIRHRDEGLVRKVALAPLRVAKDVMDRAVVNRVDRFISLTQPTSTIEISRGLNPGRLRIIPPILGDQPDRRAKKDVRDGSPLRLLYTGRLTREKGVDVLLRAVTGLRFPVHLDVVGDGSEMLNLRALADDQEIAGHVSFHGWLSQEQIGSFYSSADVFVHPGRWPEPAGRTVMDALAWGLPTVVSDVGGPPWIAGDAALTFAPGDHDDLRRKIMMLHDQPLLLRTLARAALHRARDFRREVVVAELLSFYRELIPEPRDSREAAPAGVHPSGGPL